MKIRFKSVKDRQEFADIIPANQIIADYMGMESHEAIIRSDDIIELTKNGKGIVIPCPKQDPYEGYDGWNVVIYMDERTYFVIQ